MKKTTYLFLILIAASLFTSCYKDKGNYDYTPISDIVVAGIQSSYSKITGLDSLSITPQITSSYNTNELEYTWLIYDVNNKCDTLSHKKNLSYFVSKGPGTYAIYYYVKNKTTGYFKNTSTTLTIQTQYTSGHYILKETTNGNTDMDLLLDDGRVIPNILLKTQGAALSGTPRSMGILYSQPITDPSTLEKVFAHCLGVITNDKKTNVLRASDMHSVFDHSTMFYDVPKDTPYKFYTAFWTNGYLSSNGMYSSNNTSPGSGILGFPYGISGGSDHWGFSTKTYGMIYWDETNSRILYTNYNGLASTFTDKVYPTSGLNYDCLFMGSYKTTVYALFRDKSTSKVYLYKITTSSMSKPPAIGSVIEINASSKLNTASLIASNEQSAQLIYFINNNKPYYYDVVNNLEYEMSVTSIPSDETITYISNRFYKLAIPNFDYLTIATYKNGNYKVYMYNMVGGLPNGAAVRTTSGEGKVKETHFLGTTYDYSSAMFGSFYSM